MMRQRLTGWVVIHMRSTMIGKLRTCRLFHNAATNEKALKGHWRPYKVDLDMTYSKKISRFTLLRQKITQPAVQNPSKIPQKAFNHEDFTHEDFTVRFRASCIDTAAELPEDVKDRMPTILCVHGSGGSHEDFVPLLNDLVEDHGFRAVCLNWPGLGKTAEITKGGKAVYSFSSEENVNFLLSFMDKIELNRLDIVISHDIGCVSAAYVCARSEVSPAFVVVSPLTTIPTKSILFAMLSVTMSRLWTTWPSFRPILGLLIKSTHLGQRFKGKNGIHRVNAALGIMGLDGQLINQIAYELQLKKLPKLCVYGTKDRLIDQSIQNKTAAKFGLGQEQFDMYNDDNQIIQKGTVPEDHYSKGILFQGAGNAPHRSEAYITVIQKEILKMFELNQQTNS